MPNLTWPEIRGRANAFARDWAGVSSERAEAQTFWNEFFAVFGVQRRKVAMFEQAATRFGKTAKGRIDVFWPGTLLAEHKSAGQDLDAAFIQATNYFAGIKDEELPRYVVVSDFRRIRLHDLDDGTQLEFALADFAKNIPHFGFIAGYAKVKLREEPEANIRAVQRLGELHDALKRNRYGLNPDGRAGHPLQVFLVRLLFCLFADDTGLFSPKDSFQDLIDTTRADGSDTGAMLTRLFQVLDTPLQDRQASLVEKFAPFPHVNGKLFEEALPIPEFDADMRRLLLECCALHWAAISPAIFGAMFQKVIELDARDRRRQLGAHYTSEANILKLIGPLFLDELRARFERVRQHKEQLFAFHKQLSTLHFLDPACGCGNFLVITYRELRQLELDVLQAARQFGEPDLANVFALFKVSLAQFHGIEIEEFPAQVAQVAMWLTQHQMDLQAGAAFGEYFRHLPLDVSAQIRHGNALRLDWEAFVPPGKLSYILGNPPFVGKQYQSAEQKEDFEFVAGGIKGAGVLDFVAGWYLKAAHYLSGSKEGFASRDKRQFADIRFRGDGLAPSLSPSEGLSPSPSRSEGGDEPRLRSAGGRSCGEERPAGPESRGGVLSAPTPNSNSTPPQPSPAAQGRGQGSATACSLSPPLARSAGGGWEGVALDLEANANSTPPQPSPAAQGRRQGSATARSLSPPLARSAGGGREGVALDLEATAKSTPPQPSPAAQGRGSKAPPGIEDLFVAFEREDEAARARIRCAFVSTNSISQGEQVGVLWSELFRRGIQIQFAHRTFKWTNEAPGKAAVHCVIVGFGREDVPRKRLFDYPRIDGPAHELLASNINPYLVDAPDVVLPSRRSPLQPVPPMLYGSKPADGGHLLLSDDEKNDLLAKEPAAAPWIRPFVSAHEFLHGEKRWCLWLQNISPAQLKRLPYVMERVTGVREFRGKSKKGQTAELANTPTLFAEIRQSKTEYLLVPRHSSENRAWVPMGYLSPEAIVGDSNLCVPEAPVWLFGILSSTMHMAWVRAVCGRLKSDFRYSAQIVYNNFPWPQALDDPHRATIEGAAQAVLDARAAHSGSTLAQLYDPDTMPPNLVRAHHALDRAVDAAYRADGGARTYAGDAERVAFLFRRYAELTSIV